ncbi:hypothetical protein BV25DRAFT_1916181 [Artomyces pyxidatus]|uniref:Uncharacterized protein n=1 Tax=Artomyces pyxidatus TaxID=48021 RepID=A0ACB8T1K5_9AGAM|nr:hypothetical protein BV25DRAFT_1916181 [Artomyces pyxidatus]
MTTTLTGTPGMRQPPGRSNSSGYNSLAILVLCVSLGLGSTWVHLQPSALPKGPTETEVPSEAADQLIKGFV